MKRFNTTGVCIPSKHYMVDLSERIQEIRKMVDDGKYFVINRARQYGKTTTLHLLSKALARDYEVVSLDFQRIGAAGFLSEQSFVKAFCRQLKRKRTVYQALPNGIKEEIEEYLSRKEEKAELDELFFTLQDWCEVSEKPLILMIDEVDSASDNQVFLDFLAQLREGFLSREMDGTPAFQSVILAGVTDVRHLKAKIRDEDQHKVNSPWNIASDFNIDMSLSEKGIQGMLEEYENDHHTGMDTAAVAKSIRAYTSGYPFLVSRICQIIDEQICEKMNPSEAWTRCGIDEAVKQILSEKNTLFQSLAGKLINYPELKKAMRRCLMEGSRVAYNPNQEEIVQLEQYGLIRNEKNSVRVANRIFETMLYDLFLSDEELQGNAFSSESKLAKNIFIQDGRLNMRLVMEHFIETYHQVYGPLEEKFREKDGRELFLLYLKPIINGTGNYYIEAQTRDEKRTDVIVDYLGEQYIIELKIWRGERYHEDGEQQILDYLDYFGLDTGYMLSFNFNQKKETGVKRVSIGERVLYEGTV